MASSNRQPIPIEWAFGGVPLVAPPVKGTVYRKTTPDDTDFTGWGFADVVDSASFNGALFLATAAGIEFQEQGSTAWNDQQDYTTALVWGSDDKLYVSNAPSGPGVAAGAQDPTLDTTGTYWIYTNIGKGAVPTPADPDTGAGTASRALFFGNLWP